MLYRLHSNVHISNDVALMLIISDYDVNTTVLETDAWEIYAESTQNIARNGSNSACQPVSLSATWSPALFFPMG